jgi:hypothetical protein
MQGKPSFWEVQVRLQVAPARQVTSHPICWLALHVTSHDVVPSHTTNRSALLPEPVAVHSEPAAHSTTHTSLLQVAAHD